MSRITYFADIILPLPVPNLYTYRIPFDLNDKVAEGMRVLVQFGKKKIYTGVIRRLHEQPPRNYEVKYIEAVLDQEPVVNQKQFEFWDWLSEYYLCYPGDVMNAALPSGLKLESETKILPLQDEFSDEQKKSLSDDEYLVIEAIESKKILTVKDIVAICGFKNSEKILQSLTKKGFLIREEQVKEKYKPKTEEYVKLNDSIDNEEALQEIIGVLEKKAYKQLEALLAFIQLSDRYQEKKVWIKKKEIVRKCEGNDRVVQELAKKNVFDVQAFETGRFLAEEKNKKLSELVLSDEQNVALDSIKAAFAEKKVCLLHGVTASGKTEVYIQLIRETIEKGRQVLYLLPEIALTSHIVTRLRKHFGEHVGVYHSRFNDQERVEVWQNVMKESELKEGEPGFRPHFNIVIGARSSIFLPFRDLGLVIVDEEHDPSFKQTDPAPRYNGRDSALYLARLHGADALLGSATPSIETFYLARQQRYGFASLTKRYSGTMLPEILVADIKEAQQKKEMKSHFSPFLLNQVREAMEADEQIILFQNRRGFAPVLECETCSWVPHCQNCDVSLTYHKAGNLMKCHYCGYSVKPMTTCGACGDVNLRLKGFGTEKIEEELAIFFPEAKIARMDLDTTRSRYSYMQLLHDFDEGNIDILVGTQMISKGLDFDNVALVGILNADAILHFPDFRAHERGYQLMAQVSGRAGRKLKRGRVIIQTKNPYHSIIQAVVRNDYMSVYENEILERRNFRYPPFFRLIQLAIKHREEPLSEQAANVLAQILKQKLGERVIGPEAPGVSRIRNFYLRQILIKFEREISMKQVKEFIQQAIQVIRTDPKFKGVVIAADVDPA